VTELAELKSVFSALAVLQILAIPPGIAAPCALPEAKNPFFRGASKRKTLHPVAHHGIAGLQQRRRAGRQSLCHGATVTARQWGRLADSWQDGAHLSSPLQETVFMSLAVQIRQHGGPEELHLVDVAVGEPGPGEIRIRHHAIGLNFIDVYHRTGLYPLNMPATIGMEGAGVIEAVGEGVTHLKVGDRAAYASQPPGAYCEVRVMPAKSVCKLPDAISFETGAAMMLKGLTAQYLLKKTLPVEGLQPGDPVLFHAAAGGVGLIACQWARALGLQLIATAGTDAKCQLALANGAAHAINYATEDFAARVKEITGGKGVKVVYDSVGKDTWDSSLECLRPFGLMASFGNASGPVPPFAPGSLGAKGSLYVTRQTLFSHIATRESTQAMADDLFAVVASGQILIHIDQRYPLADVQQAHRDLEARKTTGSTILTL
jgi:NADPH2:quinone reductase